MLKTMLLILLPVCCMAQQEDNWDVYMAQYEKGVGSTMINMSAINNAPNKDYPYVLITGVTFSGCSPEGLPEEKQFEELYKISDLAEQTIKAANAYLHVGTFTYQCERLEYFYVKDTALLRNKLAAVYRTYFPSYTPYINMKNDTAWEAYLGFLYPNPETQEYMKNQKVVLQLQQAGDKLEKPRKVDHWLYFNSEQDRDCMIAFIKDKNFVVEKKDKLGGTALPYSLQISRDDKVEVYSITQVTLQLRKQAAACKGNYDGWEAVLVK